MTQTEEPTGPAAGAPAREARKRATPRVEELAAFAAAARYEHLSAQVVEQVKVRVLDSLGVAVAARGQEVPERVRRFCAISGGQDPARADMRRLGPNLAGLYYGTLVRYLDFNDSYLAPHETFHPSDAIGGLLALADATGADGRDLITAIALSYQVQAQLSEAAPVRDKGFDHTVQLTYAAAAAAGRLLGLPPAGIANAVAISGTAHNALRVTRTGALSHWKGLAAPYAVHGALNAALLAREGVTGPAEVFEGNKGFEHSIAGPFTVRWEDAGLTAVLGSILKQWNAEVHSQSALEAVLAMRGRGLHPERVERLELDVFDVAYNIIGGGEEGDKQHITTKEEADHSLAYMVAAALLDGQVLPAQYEPERIAREDVQALMRRVHIRPDEALSGRFPAEMPVHLRAYGAGGLLDEQEQADYLGFHTRPMTPEDLKTKLRRLGVGIDGPPEPGRLVTAVEGLEREGARGLLNLLALG